MLVDLIKSLLPFRAKMNRAARGLYGGKEVLFGNNVSHSERKTRRRWLPNVQKKNFFSNILDRKIQLRVTTYVLRCMDKAGGFDQYILKTSDKKLDSEVGSKLKLEMKEALKKARLLEKAKKALENQTSPSSS